MNSLVILSLLLGQTDLPTGPMPHKVGEQKTRTYSDGTVMYLTATDGKRYDNGWHPCNSAKDCQLFLWRNGHVLGSFDPTTGLYREWDEYRNDWGKYGTAPEALPAWYKPKVAANFGVIPFANTYPPYSSNGHAASRGDVIQDIKEGLADDSGKKRITIVGTPEQRKQVVADINLVPDLAKARDNSVIKEYDADNWAVTGVGIPNRGNPSITVQDAPDAKGRGKVLHAQHDYDGPVNFAGALRKAAPEFNAEAVPDLRRQPQMPDVPPVYIVLGVVVLVLLLRK